MATSAQRFGGEACAVVDVRAVQEEGALAMGHLVTNRHRTAQANRQHGDEDDKEHPLDDDDDEEEEEKVVVTILPGRAFIVPARSAFLMVRARALDPSL